MFFLLYFSIKKFKIFLKINFIIKTRKIRKNKKAYLMRLFFINNKI